MKVSIAPKCKITLTRVDVDSTNRISRRQTYFSRSPSKFANVATIEKNRETFFSVLRYSQHEESSHVRAAREQ